MRILAVPIEREANHSNFSVYPYCPDSFIYVIQIFKKTIFPEMNIFYNL